MTDSFDICLHFTIQQEGGFCDVPQDPGGATCHGITLATLRQWSGNDLLEVSAIQNIPMATVQAIYSTDFWNRMRCDAMPNGPDLMLFDHGVNAGPARSTRVLQQALGFTGADLDGNIGPMTIAAAQKADPKIVVDRMAAFQSAYYQSLADFDVFGKGWLARVARRHEAALALIPVRVTA